ncbi:MAG: hypothetical protein JWN78_3115 [Bacteroidota bacterium]|nr:hypothetical protein [Bacteroidota bacterium]
MKKILLLFPVIIAFITLFAEPEFGVASFYGLEFHGKTTASGQIYSQNKLTAAHKTLPLGTTVKVTNTKNNKSVYVKINDRGPFVKGRIIDLSTKAAEILGYRNKGTAYVKVEVIGKDDIPVELLTASVTAADITHQNGIRAYDCSDLEEQSWKDIPTVNDDDNTAVETQEKRETTPVARVSNQKDIPTLPISDVQEANAGGLLNRSSYSIITNLDKSKIGFYGVQLGIFSDPSVIFELTAELEKFKQSLLIHQVSEGGKTLYKLCMGKFQNRAYADALKTVLEDKYKDAVVLMYE